MINTLLIAVSTTFLQLLLTPPILPHLAGTCKTANSSGREICFPNYEDLDTSCAETTNAQGTTDHRLMQPDSIPHATVQAMAYVPPNNLKRLIRQFYRQQGKHVPRGTKFIEKAILVVKYQCDEGYDIIDEIDEMFCSNKKWVSTHPVCKGRGLCKEDNGGCSNSCRSNANQTVTCSCPRGMILEADEKTCIKPIPKDLCRNLADCNCTSIDEVQYTCACQNGEECLMLKGEPKIYLDPQPPYEIYPGGHINITCRGVAFPFPQIHWERHHEDLDKSKRTKLSVVKSEQILIIKELFHTTTFTCHANNSLGVNQRQVHVVVKGPGSAPHVRGVNSGRTTITMSWEPPEIINNPIISYTIFYSENAALPIDKWNKLDIEEPEHDATVQNVKPNTQYYLRIRANDNMGKGRPTNPILVKTQKPAVPPAIQIKEGEELRIPPQTKFTITCRDPRSNPISHVHWEKAGTRITNPQKRRTLALGHVGLVEETTFKCVAENEAGKVEKEIKIIITGPTQPEKVQSEVEGNSIRVNWKPPKIANGDIVDYEVAYTDNPNLNITEWSTIKTSGYGEISLLNLKELTNYTIAVRGISSLGNGLWAQNISVLTGLADRAPVVSIKPNEFQPVEPSMNDIELVCEAVGVPRPQISWTWLSVPIEDGVDGFRVFDISEGESEEETRSKVVLESTTRTGSIACLAENREGIDEHSIAITVLGPGSPPMNIRSKTVENGFEVEWEAPLYPNGDITNYVLYYTKDPDLPLSEWTKIELNGDNTQTKITDLEEKATFVIKMQAKNGDGVGIISETYNVTTGIKYIPLSVKLEIKEPKIDHGETIVDPDQAIRFVCSVEGRPKPNVSYTWLPVNDTESGEESVSLPINRNDAGEHRYISELIHTKTVTKRKLICQAKNPDGIQTDGHVFTVLRPGSAPLDVKSVVDMDNSVTISWNPPVFPNGDLEKYKVYLSTDPSLPIDKWQVFEISGGEENSIEFERGQLDPETAYHAKVSAVNNDGEGITSDPINFDTVSGAPLDSPFDILVDVTKDNTVNISWIGPNLPNGDLKAYTVYLTPDSKDDVDDDEYKNWKKIEIETSDNSGALMLNPDEYNILPNTTYKIRITATNDLSEGPPSDSINFTTGSGEIPPSITFDPETTLHSIPPLTGVKVNCTAIGIPQPTVKWVLVDGSEIVGGLLELEKLIADVSVTCVAENKAGQAKQVLEVQINGPGTPPNEIVAIPQMNEILDVEWTSPEEPNGEITGYIIHYGETSEGKTEPDEWVTINVTGKEIRHKIHDLKPKTHYAVKMQAVSERGPGVESSPIVVKTLPLAPVPPEWVDIVVHENNTVDVIFDAVLDPEDKTKTLRDYKILYTTDDPFQNETEIRWRELLWTQTGDVGDEIRATIDDINFTPKTNYHLKVIAIGEIEGNPSETVAFKTGSGIVEHEGDQLPTDSYFEVCMNQCRKSCMA